LVVGSSCRVKVPIPCCLGNLSTASGCDIEDRKDLEEKPAQIESAELVVSDSFLGYTYVSTEQRPSVALGVRCTFYAARAGLISGIDKETPMEALLFGALISAMNPVATLSMMGNADLRVLVEKLDDGSIQVRRRL
jgi:hypothetical protein